MKHIFLDNSGSAVLIADRLMAVECSNCQFYSFDHRVRKINSPMDLAFDGIGSYPVEIKNYISQHIPIKDEVLVFTDEYIDIDFAELEQKASPTIEVIVFTPSEKSDKFELVGAL